jgi:hypothetical protein
MSGNVGPPLAHTFDQRERKTSTISDTAMAAAAAFFTPWRVWKGSRLFRRVLAEQSLQLQHWVLQSPVSDAGTICWSLPASAPYPVGRFGRL